MIKAILCENIPRDQADIYGLVLSASNILFTLEPSESGWRIWVDAFHYDQAVQELARYKDENPDAGQETALPESTDETPLIFSLLAALTILTVHAYLSVMGDYQEAIRQYGASASKIVEGEIYRTFTALLLHGDAAHLFGNMIGLVLFGTSVGALTGAVRGWVMILMSGVLGNLFNALMFQAHHISIGASTAVFGAVGILSAYQFSRKFRSPLNRKKAWLSLAGGLALLGFLGTGENSDITAHLFGFITGAVFGCFYKFFIREKFRQIE